MLYQDRAYDAFCIKDILYVITIKEVIMSDNTENKGKLEQFHLRGRNYDAVVRQLVEKYNASEGWAVVRVVPSILSLDVYLERNAEQGGKNEVKSTSKNTEATVSKTPVKNNLAEDVSDEKENKEVIEKPTVKKTAAKQTTKK